MAADPTDADEELDRLAEARATVARARFARAMSGPWRVGMWAAGLVTAGSLGAFVFLIATGRGDALTLLVLAALGLVGLTAAGMIATLYPGPVDELERTIEGDSRKLEQRVAGVKTRLDLATSKGNRDRGPYGSGQQSLARSELDAVREEVEASLDELDRARRVDRR